MSLFTGSEECVFRLFPVQKFSWIVCVSWSKGYKFFFGLFIFMRV